LLCRSLTLVHASQQSRTCGNAAVAATRFGSTLRVPLTVLRAGKRHIQCKAIGAYLKKPHPKRIRATTTLYHCAREAVYATANSASAWASDVASRATPESV